MTTPLDVTDASRLAALDAYAILDTPSEAAFENIARLATRLCRAPTALVSLVAEDRQWFKARVNFPDCETDLSRSVCQYALAEPDLLVIPDLTTDPRTRDNPLVTGAPFIRFYAGAPLRTPEGHVLGSLCVIDTKVRPGGLTSEQGEDLRALADEVMTQLALRRTVLGRDAVLARQDAELRRERHLTILAEASAALLTASDPSRVIEPILTTSAASLGFAQCFIYDIAPDARRLHLTNSVGASEAVRAALADVDIDGPLCGIVVQTGRPIVLSDVLTSVEARYALAQANGINAFAGYPILSRGRLVGVISFCAPHVAFDEGALTFFATIARYLSAVRERLDGDAALRASNTRARLAQEGGRVGTFEVEVATGLAAASPEMCRIYGLPEAGLYSADAFLARVLPEDIALPSNEATRQDGSAAPDVEYRIRRANDGAVRWIARRARFEHGADGVPVRMFGTVQDVTERREAQEALRASDERFRTITETIDAAFAIVEVKFDADDRPVDYRFVEANPAFERQAGVNLRGKWVTEFAPDLERFWFETYGHVASTGEPANFENYAEAFGRWFDVRAVRVGRPEERRIAILFNDVTARKEAEAALRVSEAVARENAERVQLALAAGAIIGTWHWDIPGDRFMVDEAFARTFGLDPALGREGIPLAQIVATVHPDDQAGLADAIAEAIARGGAYAHQYRVRRLDGRYYWIAANGRVDHAPDGTPLAFPGVLLDVEERRAAEGRRNALLALGDQLRDLADVPALVQAAAEIMAGVTGATRAGYGLVDVAQETVDVPTDWCAPGVVSIARRHALRDYGSYIDDLKRGEVVAIDDVTLDPRTRDNAEALLGIGARVLLNVPILEHGQLVGLAFLNFAHAHAFSEDELAFVRTVADRVQTAVARVRAEERQDLLNHELSHRLKNTLSVVMSVANQTLRAVPDRAPVQAFEQRVQALASAHDVLLRGNWTAASLRTVCEDVLRRVGPLDRIDLDGPEVALGPTATMSASLLMHELATNAAKYGALSGAKGKVEVRWGIEAGAQRPDLVLSWRERGGPPVVAPTQRGFGSRLIRTGLVGTGGVAVAYPSEGFEASMRAPLAEVQRA